MSKSTTVKQAKPFEFKIKGNPCLIIIDMQKDFIEPKGFGESLGNDVSLLEPCIQPIKSLLTFFRKHNFLVVHTKETHNPNLTDCFDAKRFRGEDQNPGQLKIGDTGPMGRILIDGEIGNDFIDDLKPKNNEMIIKKQGKGAFYNTNLDEYLQKNNINQLIFTGVTTEVCVQTSIREANDRGYECLIIEDATESYFPEFKQSTIDMITAQGGIVGWSCDSQTFIGSFKE
jgi:nicotinamidase-related amidase